MASPPTPRVQLAGMLLAEMVLRAGDIIAQRDTGRLKQTYQIVDPTYPDAIGISVVFRPGANLDQLVQAGGPFPHNKVSYTIIATLIHELDLIGLVPILFITPSNPLPDHHSLAVAQKGTIQPEMALSDAAAQALINAFSVVDNPYKP